MRRALVLFICIVLAATLGLTFAAGADSTVVLPGITFPTAREGFNPYINCANPGFERDPETSSVDLVPAYSGDASLGERSLQIHPEALGQAAGVAAYVPNPSTATFEARARASGASTAEGRAIAYYLPPTGNKKYFVGYALQTVSDTWQTISSTAFTWVKVARGTGLPGNPLGPETTLAAFAATHGGDATSQGGGAYLGFVYGCDRNDVLLDKLKVGSPGSMTTYDLEGYDLHALIRATKPVITATRPVSVIGDMDKPVYTTIPFVLEAKAYGETGFSQVDTVTFQLGDDIPGAPLVVHPLVRTVYRYRIESQPSTAGALTDEVTVYVRSRVTISAPERIRRGRQFEITGATTPAKSLRPTVLQVRQNKHWNTIADTSTTNDGRYRFSVNAYDIGTAHLRVQVAGGGGNRTGTSPTRSVLVHR